MSVDITAKLIGEFRRKFYSEMYNRVRVFLNYIEAAIDNLREKSEEWGWEVNVSEIDFNRFMRYFMVESGRFDVDQHVGMKTEDKDLRIEYRELWMLGNYDDAMNELIRYRMMLRRN